MTDSETLHLRATAGTDPGLHRSNNEDSGYRSSRLLVVADGMGGHAYGEVASATAVNVLADLDSHLGQDAEAGVDLLDALSSAIGVISTQLTDLAEEEPELSTMGTTVTAFLWDPDAARFAIAHIGDSRAYLLRENGFGQLTRDHTLVQSLVDEGKLTPEQAANHPRRSVLMRALQSGGSSEPDLSYWQVRTGDRYLLCSDGLCDVVSDELIGQVLASIDNPDDAVATLIDLAKQGGGPDNITCVLCDIVAQAPDALVEPIIIGAAAQPQTADNGAE